MDQPEQLCEVTACLVSKDALEKYAYVATILGVPLAIGTYFFSKIKERSEREYATYDALDNKYIDFLKLCMDKPELKILNARDDETFESSIQAKREIVYEILICLFERSFLMYKRHSSKIRKTEWDGWEKYIICWLKNLHFKKYWNSDELQAQYNAEFVNQMNTIQGDIDIELTEQKNL